MAETDKANQEATGLASNDLLADLKREMEIKHEAWRVAYKGGGFLPRAARYKENGLWRRFKNAQKRYEAAQSDNG